VRLFDSTPASDWWICLDLDQHAQVGHGWDSTEEHGVMLAASLADRGLRAGRAVGLVTQGQELVWLPPQGGDGQRLSILRALALVTPGSRPLAEVLGRTRPGSGQCPSLVIITPAVHGNWVEALFPLLQRGVVPTILLLDPVSFGRSGDGAGELAQVVSGTLALLSDLGVARYVITRDLLDRSEARPGRQGQWEWRISPTGRAVPVHRPRDTVWKKLS
jgi:uncharacterized protein (DUF58 family)